MPEKVDREAFMPRLREIDQRTGIDKKIGEPVYMNTTGAWKIRAQTMRPQIAGIDGPAFGCKKLAGLAVAPAVLREPMNEDNDPPGFRSCPRLPV